MDEKIVKLQELIDQHDNIVFFGGAGVSPESGIPDFRYQDGLYHQKYDYPPEAECGSSETGRAGRGWQTKSGHHTEY